MFIMEHSLPYNRSTRDALFLKEEKIRDAKVKAGAQRKDDEFRELRAQYSKGASGFSTKLGHQIYRVLQRVGIDDTVFAALRRSAIFMGWDTSDKPTFSLEKFKAGVSHIAAAIPTNGLTTNASFSPLSSQINTETVSQEFAKNVVNEHFKNVMKQACPIKITDGFGIHASCMHEEALLVDQARDNFLQENGVHLFVKNGQINTAICDTKLHELKSDFGGSTSPTCAGDAACINVFNTQACKIMPPQINNAQQYTLTA